MNHLDAIGKQIHRIPNDFPKLILKRPIKDINNIDENNFEIVDYNYYPILKQKLLKKIYIILIFHIIMLCPSCPKSKSIINILLEGNVKDYFLED